MTDQIIFWNGNILRMDSKGRKAGALAILRGKVAGWERMKIKRFG